MHTLAGWLFIAVLAAAPTIITLWLAGVAARAVKARKALR